MSDARLRELERRWKRSKAVEDEAALLAERVRVGELDQNMLDLAARLGHPAAILSVAGIHSSKDLWIELWVERAVAFSREASVRAAIACAKEVLSIFETEYPQNLGPRRAIEAAVKWVRCPCDDHKNPAVTNESFGRVALLYSNTPRAADAGLCSMAALRAVTWENRFAKDSACVAANHAMHATSGDSAIIRQAISTALIPWALGYGDPLLDDHQTD